MTSTPVPAPAKLTPPVWRGGLVTPLQLTDHLDQIKIVALEIPDAGSQCFHPLPHDRLHLLRQSRAAVCLGDRDVVHHASPRHPRTASSRGAANAREAAPYLR